MIHIYAIIGLVLACAVWVAIQVLSGRFSGGCGACGTGGSCRKGDGSKCQKDAAAEEAVSEKVLAPKPEAH